ncbi:hypothetical protein CABS01_13619 [Colletotrichum abscissum]|uniref:Uncharacterized protein n=1 Tax=Colletotrichum melonis TaxID=1209925 RepID=A0AAI9USE8_9PEZI|nr:uncharacterized protein CABS01_13619 [Colletotrichum abscissum]KAK1462553.1 hypothetical protein CMEL01_13664 [Colletotrichum melonis]KAK1485324.1 hypothetical protein CABS01_13619 [Colletotrichum abscissum]
MTGWTTFRQRHENPPDLPRAEARMAPDGGGEGAS